MRKLINLTGQRFGKLIVLYEIPERKFGHVYWHCKCDCGNELDVYGYHLRIGKTKSCGCLQKEIASKIHLNDLKGQKFGKLTAIEKVGNNEKGQVFWKCKCDCGNVHITLGSHLINGNTKSCGCIRSKGELKISQILRENDIKFEQQKTFQDCKDINLLPFDFYVINQYLIEFDGEQHFKSIEHFGGDESFQIRQKHDIIKNNYCKKNNIPLIRIPYTHLNDLILEDLKFETSSFLI